MFKLIALSAIIMMSVTSTAQAQELQLRLTHKSWAVMTTAMKTKYLKKQIFHDNAILRVAKHQHPQTRDMRHAARWAQISLRIATKNLQKLLYRVAVGSDMAAWLCIHRYEGSWTDSGSPYWGGLQMDLGFQETYGGEFLRTLGTADHWPIGIQILVARRARDGYGRHGPRGYTPWPNTARYCGLVS